MVLMCWRMREFDWVEASDAYDILMMVVIGVII